MPAAAERVHKQSSSTLIVIGIFKLITGIVLFGLGVGLVYWQNHEHAKVASDWINQMWGGRPAVDAALAKLSSIQTRTIEQLAVGAFIYSVLLLIEGFGLCRQRRWAEFLTVGITASLLPLESSKLIHDPTATAVIAALINLAIVVVLIVRLLGNRRRQALIANATR
jgi:uncharacterized membrane protein (DUF2068 family)